MSVYIIRDPKLLQKMICEAISSLWVNTTVSDLVDVGNQKRICFTVDGKPAKLDIYQKSDGTTSFKATGKNQELTDLLIKNLEERGYPTTSLVKSVTIYIGDEWKTKTVEYLVSLTAKDNYGSYESKINNGNTIHSFTSAFGDKLTLTECPDGKVFIQGKPLFLYNEFISFVSYSPNVNMDEIIEATRAFVSDKAINVEAAKAKMAALMPKAYNSGVIDETIWKVFSPSMALLDVNLDMEDYSCCTFPALRALEGYLLFLLDEIGETIDKHHIIGNIFREDTCNPGNFVMVKRAAIIKANSKGPNYKSALEQIYAYLNIHRHVSFHMKQLLIDTKVIENKEEARTTVNDVAMIIEKTFCLTHP